MTVIIDRTVPDGGHAGRQLHILVRRDKRLRKSVRWTVHDDEVDIRVPVRLRQREIDAFVDDVIAKVIKQRARARKHNDFDLQSRAEQINKRYFGGAVSWHTIRWVTNMERRLGSCTVGGSTDGDIRISDRIKPWPSYVIDYVIAHELTHRIHANHSKAFWAYLDQYPDVERARGFIEGIAFARNIDPDTLL